MDENELLKFIAKPSFVRTKIFNEVLLAVHKKKKVLTFNKPAYVGMCILVLMYDFHYNYIKYGDRAKLLFTDTDSLMYEIETDDAYQDFWNEKDKFDNSDYPEESPYFDKTNKKVIGTTAPSWRISRDKYNHANSFVPSRDFDHFAITSPCESLPCQNGGTCRPLYDTNSYVCQCAEGNNGTYCEHEWQKVNVDPVCFGTKNDSFGTFEIHKPGDIYRLKLVHRSGYVNCEFPTAFNTKWGCAYIEDSHFSQKLNVHITNENNTPIFPANVDSSKLDVHFYYTLPGFNRNSSEIVFDYTPTPLSVVAGQKFRIWYGEDLANNGEGDNMGGSCTDVYAFRQ
ncbi:uncharacterized protein [Montipora capricornis]|uniref:uncharacterized protein n=1 Tax=Montipora capricornis TaxID=246305 RepID=UPI0035F1202A